MRVLFVCGDYFPKPSANGVCVIRVQEALLGKGIQSDVICVGNKGTINNTKFGEVFTVSGSNGTNKNNSIKRLLDKVKLLTSWPIKDKKIIDAYEDAINKMAGRHPYDLIISVLRPIEGAVACSKFKNVIIYELDSITNNGENLYGIKHVLSYRSKNIEKIIYDNAYRVFHLKCHEGYYSDSGYDWVRGKFEFTDIPHLINRGPTTRTVSDGTTRITYTGSLTKVRNSPEYVIKLLEKCSTELSLQCYFFSRGDCERILQDAHERRGDLIVPKGYVSQEELAIADGNTDVYLSIGFHHTGTVTSIPSKIFEYMSTGKPVLHIAGGENDTAIDYLKKYRNALILYPSNPLQENARELIEFIKRSKGMHMNVNGLRSILPMNTPEWTAERFIDIAKELNGGK